MLYAVRNIDHSDGMEIFHVMYVIKTSFFAHKAALTIVKEVANHANDIMKQGVRGFSEP